MHELWDTRAMVKLLKYVLIDILRNKIVAGYAIALFLISMSIFQISETSEKAIISLLNIELIVLPLICGVFSTIYYYNSAEFIELLVTQPMRRVTIIRCIIAGLSISLCLAFLLGVGLPLLIFSTGKTSLIFILSGMLLTACFSSFALLGAIYTKDKAKGIGVTILLWFYFTLIYDGLILFLLFQFSDYPIENYMILLSCLNPVDLVRILILLEIDIAAIMGYTGVLFRDFFGSTGGLFLSALILITWIGLPAWMAIRKFKKKDL